MERRQPIWMVLADGRTKEDQPLRGGSIAGNCRHMQRRKSTAPITDALARTTSEEEVHGSLRP